MNRPDPADQLQALRDGSTVIVPASRTKLAVAVAGAAGFVLLGLLLIAVPISYIPSEGPLVLISGSFFAGTLAVLVFGVWLLPRGIRGLARPCRLVLDAGGLGQEVRCEGRWEPVTHLPWTAIEEVFVRRVGRRWPNRGTPLCCYRLTEAAAAAAPQPSGRVSRWSAKADARILGPRAVSISSVFGRASWLLELLGSAHRQHSGPGSTPGHPSPRA